MTETTHTSDALSHTPLLFPMGSHEKILPQEAKQFLRDGSIDLSALANELPSLSEPTKVLQIVLEQLDQDAFALEIARKLKARGGSIPSSVNLEDILNTLRTFDQFWQESQSFFSTKVESDNELRTFVNEVNTILDTNLGPKDAQGQRPPNPPLPV